MSLFSWNSGLLDKCCEKQISETKKRFFSINIETDGYTDGRGHHVDRYSFSSQRRLRSKFIPPQPAINTLSNILQLGCIRCQWLYVINYGE